MLVSRKVYDGAHVQSTGIPALDRSSRRQDRQGYASSVEALEWSELSADALHAIADNALTLEMLDLCRSLIEHALQRFPEDARFLDLQRILAPAKILGSSPASGVEDRAASRQWLRDNQHRFPGLWIAVKDGKLLGAAKRLDELRPTIQAEGAEGTLVVRVLS